MQLGAALAVGSRSTIHAWGPDAVAKVPLAATPEGWIEAEAAFTVAVHRAGAPVPRPLGVEVLDGRAVAMYERVRGRSMWRRVLDQPADTEALLTDLAVLHGELFALTAPVEVPRQLDRTRAKIRRAAEDVDIDLLDVLGAVPPIVAAHLCHGDLHPGNVIVDGTTLVVIDWFDVSRGEPVADVARSLLLMAPDGHGPSGPDHLPGSTAALLERMTAAYRLGIESRVEIDDAALARWTAILAVARIAEGVEADPLRRQWEAWRHAG